MRNVDVDVYMDSLESRRVPSLGGFLSKRHRETHQQKKAYAWNAMSYGLTNTEYFNDLTNKQQELMLIDLSQDRIEEAFHIEKSGMTYGAKMVLMSQTLDERQLYSFFTGDEARHFEMISRHLKRSPVKGKTDDFLRFLAKQIETQNKNTLVFLIQVLLEGWGLTHYGEMAESCDDLELKLNLESILIDEVGHHGSGVKIFDELALCIDDRKAISDSVQVFFEMVQVGPINLASRLTERTKTLSKSNLRQFLEDIDAFNVTQKKMNCLTSLMQKAGANELISQMSEKGFMKALDIDKMTDLIYASCEGHS